MTLDVPKDVYAIYLIEISFYLHSLYATLFVDHWRRDTLVLMGHHIVTSLLLVFSLSIRYDYFHIIIIIITNPWDQQSNKIINETFFSQQD